MRNKNSIFVCMIIAVNTRLLIKDKLEGIGWYTYETLSRMVKSHPEHEFYFLFDRPYSKEFIFEKNVHPVVISPPTRHPILWYIWFEWRIPKILRKINADVFLSPDGFLSLKSKTLLLRFTTSTLSIIQKILNLFIEYSTIIFLKICQKS